MPVLESTDEITPRSALRHRPIGDDAARSGKGSAAPSIGTVPVAQRASRLRPKQIPYLHPVEDIILIIRGEILILSEYKLMTFMLI